MGQFPSQCLAIWYLRSRSFFVKIVPHESSSTRCHRGFSLSWMHVISVVSQGTALGPALLLIFINEIGNKLTSSRRRFKNDKNMSRIFKLECIDEHGISSIAVSSGAAYPINPSWLTCAQLGDAVRVDAVMGQNLGLPHSGLPLGLDYGIPNILYFCVKITKKKA